MRRLVIFLMALVALSGSVTAAFATIQQRDADLRGYVDPTQNANLPFRVPRLGVNAALEQYTPAELRQQLDLMQSANVTWVRQMVPWGEIEPQPGEQDWSQWDAIIEALDEYPELQLIPVLHGAPAWARTERAADHPTAPPDNPDVFADFTSLFAARYGDSIDHYQIWDEPNLRDAWGGLDPRPAEYAALLNASYNAIHSADPDATIIAAALAPTIETGPHNLNEWLYLEALYNLGAAAFMDAVGAKPYGFDSSPDDRTVDPTVMNVSRVVRLREIMVANGDGQKAVWASNWGWNSLPDDWTGSPSIWEEVDSATRTDYTLALLARAEREWPWMAGMMLQHWQPDAALDNPVWGFALVNQQNAPTPLLNALIARETPAQAHNGLYAPDTRHSAYSGIWTFGELGADVGWLADSHLSFDFYGEDISLLLREGDYIAYLYPTIDDEPANATPRDADGNPYIILTSPTLETELSLIPVARDLPLADHTLRAVADRGWDRWILAGYAVSTGNLAAPYNRQIAIAWGTAIIALVAVMVTGWRMRWRDVFAPVNAVFKPLGYTTKLLLGLAASGLLLLGMFLTWGDGLPNLVKRDGIVLIISVLTAGLIYIEPGLIITAVAAACLFFIIYNRVEVGLLLTIIWTPFFLFPVQLYLYAFPMAEVMVLLTFGAWLTKQLVNWARAHKSDAYTTLSMRLSAIDWGVLAFVGVSVLSLSWTTYLDPALTELRVMVVEPALFYLMLRTTIRTERQTLWLIDALLLSVLAMSVIGLFMYITGQNVITAEADARRLAGVYGSPNNVALFLGRVIPFALAYALLLRGQWRWQFGVGVLAITLPTFALTQSVGGLFVGLPAAIAVVILLVWRRRAVLPLIGLAIAGVGAFAFLSRFPRFGGVLDFTSGTNFRRLRVWQSGLQVIQDYPLTGLGLDQFLYAFRSHYIMPDAWQEPDLSHPHNFILDFWTRLGGLGVLAFLWLQVAFWHRIVHLYQQNRLTPPQNAMVIGAAGAMTNLLAHGLVDNSVFVNDLALVFVLLLALPQTITEMDT